MRTLVPKLQKTESKVLLIQHYGYEILQSQIRKQNIAKSGSETMTNQEVDDIISTMSWENKE